ncbi:aquaporin [Frondihabitans australicus]|uniref:MIP family channel protein n=1 Tax=Frondihabitans australicus TaxID=386892 RepID=A0A495IKL9_9MICO|nr:aquaporin [Frondihabitans australicus]RKR76329.1 MIP family channel protein [Frondihabitans australicus]
MTFPAAPKPARPTRAGKWAAEFAGTFLLTFGLVGAATFSAAHVAGAGTPAPVGILGVALALGLTVIIGAYAFGPISGGHFNPAVSLGLTIAGRLSWRDLPEYVISQALGALLGTTAVLGIAAGAGHTFLSAAVNTGFASNGYGGHSPGGFGIVSAIIVEVVGTAVFVFVILGVTNARSNPSVAPFPIGITLTLLLLVAIPVDNAGFNPARSLATAVFGGGPWMGQLWLFVVAPAVGAAIAGASNQFLFETATKNTDASDGQ